MTLLTQPPGNLAYHLVLVFTLAGALQLAYLQRRWSPYPQTERLFWGLAVLLTVRTGILAVEIFVPSPAGRYAAGWLLHYLSILFFVWLWAFPEPWRRADWATLLLGLFGLSLAGLSWGVASRALPLLETLWLGLCSVVGLGGLALLYRRRPQGGFFGAVAVAALTLAPLAHWVLEPVTLGYASLLRAGELMAYPLLFSLPYRFLPAANAAEAPAPPPRVLQPAPPPPAVHTLRALLDLLTASAPSEQRWALMAEVGAHHLVADLCLLLGPPHTDGRVEVRQGFDLIQEQTIPGFRLDGDRLPVVTAALRKGRPLRLPASSTSMDLDTLARALELPQPGPLLLVPVFPPEPDATEETAAPVGAFLFLTPYSQRSWSGKDLERAEHLARALAPLLVQSKEVEHLREVSHRLEQLQAEHEALLARWESAQEHLEEMGLLLEELERLRQRLRDLEEENRTLKAQLHDLAVAEPPLEADAQVQQLQQELRLALEEIASLRNELARADQKLLELEQSSNASVRSQVLWESLRALSQDLRQPLSAIVGYTELLLKEQAGILGDLQREFVERVRNAAQRVNDLVGDFLHLVALEMGESDPGERIALDLGQVLDEVVTQHAHLLREKQLGLRVELPHDLPRLSLSPEVLHQIVAHLFRNAVLASREGGEVLVRARVLREGRERHLALEFADSGNGIPPEDIPRVFSRIYRAGNRLIEGLGDNGVGLPLVKALVESQGGRIWANSQPGQGSTFTVVFPLNGEQAGSGLGEHATPSPASSGDNGGQPS